jgi:[protein-PII] uridylyltransferase
MSLQRSSAAPQPTSPLQVWKQQLALDREEARGRFATRPAPGTLLRKLSAIVDRHVRTVWNACSLPADMALVAVGGYGRGQLFPYSDVDILILLAGPASAELRTRLEALIGALWDIGLEVGHSVRTIDECVEMAHQDITVQTTLLESRLIAGQRALFRRFLDETSQALDVRAFLEAKMLEQQQRHARFQETSLEPNVKESAGGLRDLQNILWIARASGVGKSWSELTEAGLISAGEAADIHREERFLQALRIRLHYLGQRREDRLLFDHQSSLAAQFGLRDRPDRLASEQLMQRYYRTAKVVSQLNTILLQNLTDRIVPEQDPTAHPVNARFVIRGQRLHAIDEGLYEREPNAILETFVLLQEYHELKGIGAETLRALWRARNRMGPAFRRDPKNHELFIRILRSPTRVVRALRRMNQYGILGRYIPAFGRVVGQMQHDLYHVHTVDEHILKVVRNLRRFAVPELAHEFPLCSRLMSDFPHPELLYLAGLFHDIAKGRGGDHSQLGKTDARRFCRAHGLSPEDTELVTWLVEQHLAMSVTAQKQDLSDPDVIRAFAMRAGTEQRLAALYLLTVADIRGTSPKVWNGWKAKLLEDLFRASRRLLSGEHTTLETSMENRQAEARAKLRLYAVPDHAEEKLWAQLETPYFLRHDAEEIAWHTRQLYYRVRTPKPVVKTRLSPAGEGLQVMVYLPDQKELFARICSFFESIRYDIIEAKIYTTRDGYALDTFQVHDPDNRDVQYRDVISYIEYELGQRLEHQTPLPPLTQPRLNRQLRHFPIQPEVDLQPDERNTYQVLSIIAGDRPGLLSRIARVLVTYDINLQTAKINTLGSRAEDVFLITGAALHDTKRVVKLEADLLEQLRTA